MSAISLLKNHAMEQNSVPLVDAALNIETRTCFALSCIETAIDLSSDVPGRIDEIQARLRQQNLLGAAAVLLRMNLSGEQTAFATGDTIHKA